MALGDGEGVALLVPRVRVHVPGPEEAQVGVVDGDDSLHKCRVVHNRIHEVYPRPEDGVGVLRLDRSHTRAVEDCSRRLVRFKQGLHLLLYVTVDFVPLKRL